MVYIACEGGDATMKDTILLVEDDANILRTNRRILEREGFQVLCADSLEKARIQLSMHTPSALVLDIRLPDGSGIAFCEEIRPTTSAPVLFLTALDEKSEIIEGLMAGGNDYITKPYDVDEFLARVKAQMQLAHMNRKEAEKSGTLKHGPLMLDIVAMRAFLHDEDMMLSAREFSLLFFLLKHHGKTLSAKEIYEGAWSQPMAKNASALWKCISRLKSKLAGSESEISLMNFRNEGYSLEVVETDISTHHKIKT